MRKIFIIFFIGINLSVSAQVSFSEGVSGRFIQVQDINGRSLVKGKYDGDIEGSPFLNNDWSYVTLLLKQGKELKNIKANINIESNELYVKDSANKVLVVADHIVSEIIFPGGGSLANGSRVFRNGYPPVDKQSVNFFYEVLADGKIQLLKRLSKSIDVNKNELSGEVRKAFVENSRYYILADKGMEDFKYQKEYLLELLKDKQAAVEDYLKTNKINFKKIPDVQKLITYYNGLK